MRETDLEQRERKDAERAAYIRARQVRLGDVSAPEVEEVVEEPSKAKSASRKKST